MENISEETALETDYPDQHWNGDHLENHEPRKSWREGIKRAVSLMTRLIYEPNTRRSN